MKKLVLLAALVATACQQDTKNLERKVDELNKKVDQLLAGGGNRAGAAAQQRPQRAEPDRAKTYSVPIEGDHFDGPADAKVTVVKAYDYACPYCEKVRDTMEELRKKYGSDLRIVYKQFVVHPQVATAGALAFCAAAKQGKALQMDALLWDKGYKNHNYDKDATAEAGGQAGRCWESPAGCPVVVGFAQELQLNVDKFKTDMKECQAVTTKDMRDLQQLGVGATPSFFVNGRFISGAVPIENFTGLVDEEMKKANERIQQGTPQASYYQTWIVEKGQKTLDAPK
ncbi:MAG: oxidoreductase [Myxococcales bacterium]|nr:oxidoreductase [Myxococcales bacterium]